MDSINSLPSLSDYFVSGEGKLGDDEDNDGINLVGLINFVTEMECEDPILPFKPLCLPAPSTKGAALTLLEFWLSAAKLGIKWPAPLGG